MIHDEVFILLYSCVIMYYMNKFKNITPVFALSIYILVFIWSAINPVDYKVWQIEAMTSLLPVLLLVILYIKGVRFSAFAYVLCAIFPLMHIVGAHYTFANVPFDWFNSLIGSERNMYDRVAHASVGLYSFLLAELFVKYKLSNYKWVIYMVPLLFIMSLAMSYELFEWWYAVSVNPEAGIEVLGSQGDIWDAQKDMLMDTIGAFAGILFYYYINNKRDN